MSTSDIVFSRMETLYSDSVAYKNDTHKLLIFKGPVKVSRLMYVASYILYWDHTTTSLAIMKDRAGDPNALTILVSSLLHVTSAKHNNGRITFSNEEQMLLKLKGIML